MPHPKKNRKKDYKPPSIAAELTNNISPATTHSETVKKSSKLKAVIDSLDAYWRIIEFLGFVVAVAVLVASFWANLISNKSLELTRKQVMASHVPWIGLENISVAPDTSKISYTLKNYSDSPAVGLKESIELRKNGVDLGIKYDSGYSERILMPGQSIITGAKIEGSDAKKLYERLISHEIELKYFITYFDVFGRKFSLTQTITTNRNSNTPDWGISDSVFLGMEQLK